ncbi:ABC transporter permease [Clostridium butyricum]|jgi:teichoic acid transport system permease protein|uniref:Transport permease protein n=1 Tax=Clostridium butyricum TaxID=1492 RepID=A0A6L9ENW7_CLOBU|nr:ABC transporter permease [Clostridium butyricum]MDU5820136.1 ABC transporter permease [Clostridium butyricum]NAS18202.1 ABC transporter permease [Clostridium butyricum]
MRNIGNLIKEIYIDRELLWNFSLKDFKRRFAGSFFGMAWAFIQPLLTMIIYWVVFQFGFRSGDVGEVPFVLWFMCGIIPWLFISEAFSIASNSFLEYSYLVKKVIFNINILPLVKILSSVFIHLFFIILLTIICSIFGYYPNIYMIQIVYYMVCSIIFVFSISLICSSIMVFFRDLNQIIGVILLIGMWGTPIAWNSNMFPERIQFILKLNPIYYLVEGYRDCFVNHIWFWEKYNQTMYFWVLTIVFIFIGSIIYNRLKPHFADVL